jgi:ParB family chromosome partitioning protein
MTDYVATMIPISEILVDPEFNCRGNFTAQSIKELADSISEIGRLICPVVVQPWDLDGFPYRLVAGFRRMKAATLFLKWTEILAHVANITDHEARILNLIENLERKNLNILEEARALQKIYPAGETQDNVKAELKKPKEWIRARFYLLTLPESMQQQAAAGLLTASDILSFVGKSTKEQLKLASLIEEQRKTLKNYRKPGKVRCERPTAETLRSVNGKLLKWGIDGLPTRAIAWAAGDISTESFMKDVEKMVQKIRRVDKG